MRPARLLMVFAGAAGVLALAQIALAAAPQIGAAAPDFTLTTVDGKTFSLAQEARTHKAVVVMFIATKCPYSNAYNDRMRDMAAAYARQHGFGFSLMKDPDNKVADLYDARHTPEIFVVDPEGKLRYHGRIDENYEDASKVTSPDLKNALDSMLAGKAIAKAETKAFGCSIKRV